MTVAKALGKAHLNKGKFTLEVDEQSAAGEEVAEGLDLLFNVSSTTIYSLSISTALGGAHLSKASQR